MWTVALEVITLIASVVAAGASVASVMIVVRKPRHDLKLRLYVDDQPDDRLNIELELESPEPATIRKFALTLVFQRHEPRTATSAGRAHSS